MSHTNADRPTQDERSEMLTDFVVRARERLAASPPEPRPGRGVVPRSRKHDLSPERARTMEAAELRPAAVLVPIVARRDPTLLLTQRAAALNVHAGQISFPGGKLDPSDPDPLATALREAEEEVGLAPGHADPLGYLDPYVTGTGFHIVPVVALISPAFEVLLNPAEVDEAFEVPLEFVMSPANHARHSRAFSGIVRSFYAMPYGDRYIWGITAGIIRKLYERVYR